MLFSSILPLYDSENLSIRKFCHRYKLNISTFTKYLKECGRIILTSKDILNIDEHVFDSIDTEDKAYWLGFLYADGCIGSKNHLLYLGLAKKDE